MKMRTGLSFSIGAIAIMIGFGALAQHSESHRMLTPSEIKWGPGPNALPPGAQGTVLLGNPGKPGAFVLRLKAPKGYHIPPHTHPKAEVVTVISGTFRIGLGNSADREKTTALPAGSFFVVEPGHAHYGYADDDIILQLSGEGPFGITYVNPQDDPRQSK
jgi:quercetin dioxygenase-like cupin family protein